MSRCVLGELVRRKPLFTGADELQQLMAISIVCGSPSTAVWPTVVHLPRFYTVKTRPQYQRRLRSEFCEYVNYSNCCSCLCYRVHSVLEKSSEMLEFGIKTSTPSKVLENR